jgi:hypothetical protein
MHPRTTPGLSLDLANPKRTRPKVDDNASESTTTRPSDALPTFVPHDYALWPRDWARQAWLTGTFLNADDSASEVEDEYLRYVISHCRSATAGAIAILIILVIAFAIAVVSPVVRSDLTSFGMLILTVALCGVGSIVVIVAEQCIRLEGRSAHEQRQGAVVVERSRFLLHLALDFSYFFSGMRGATDATYSINTSVMIIGMMMAYFVHIRFSRSLVTLSLMAISYAAGTLAVKADDWDPGASAFYYFTTIVFMIPFVAIGKIVDLRARSRFVAIVSAHFARTAFNRNEVVMSRIMQTVVPPALLPRLTDAASINDAWYLDTSPNCVIVVASVPSVSSWASNMVPMDAVRAIHAIFCRFDGIMSDYEARRNIRRAVVSGDKYVVCGGLLGGMLKSRRAHKHKTLSTSIDASTNYSQFAPGTLDWKRELLRDMLTLARDLANVSAEVERSRQELLREVLSESRLSGAHRSIGGASSNTRQHSQSSFAAFGGPESFANTMFGIPSTNVTVAEPLHLCIGVGAGRCLGGIHGEEAQFRYVLYGQALEDSLYVQQLGAGDTDTILVSKHALTTVAAPPSAEATGTGTGTGPGQVTGNSSGNQTQSSRGAVDPRPTHLPAPEANSPHGSAGALQRRADGVLAMPDSPFAPLPTASAPLPEENKPPSLSGSACSKSPLLGGGSNMFLSPRQLNNLAAELLPQSLRFTPLYRDGVWHAAYVIVPSSQLDAYRDLTAGDAAHDAPPKTRSESPQRPRRVSMDEPEPRSDEDHDEGRGHSRSKRGSMTQAHDGTLQPHDPNRRPSGDNAQRGGTQAMLPVGFAPLSVSGTAGFGAPARDKSNGPKGLRVNMKRLPDTRGPAEAGVISTRSGFGTDLHGNATGAYENPNVLDWNPMTQAEPVETSHAMKSANAVFAVARTMHHPAEFVSKLITQLSASVTMKKWVGTFDAPEVEASFRANAAYMDAPAGGVIWTAAWTSFAAAFVTFVTILAEDSVSPPKFGPKDGDSSMTISLVLFLISGVIFIVTAVATSVFVKPRARGLSAELPQAFYVVQTAALSAGFAIGAAANVVAGPTTIVGTNRVGLYCHFLGATLILARWQSWPLKLAMMIGALAFPSALLIILVPKPAYGATFTDSNAFLSIGIFSLALIPFIYFTGLDTRVEYAVLRVCELVREASRTRAELTRRLTRGLVPEHLIDDVVQRFLDADELETDGGVNQPQFSPPPPILILRRPLRFFTQQPHGSFWQRCAVQPAPKMTATFGELCVVAMQFQPFAADSERPMLRLRGGLLDGGNFDAPGSVLLPTTGSWNTDAELTSHTSGLTLQTFTNNTTTGVTMNPLDSRYTSGINGQTVRYSGNTPPSQSLFGQGSTSTQTPRMRGFVDDSVPADAEAALSVLDEVDSAVASVPEAYLRVVNVLGDQLMIAGPIGEPKTSDEEDSPHDSEKSKRTSEEERKAREEARERALHLQSGAGGLKFGGGMEHSTTAAAMAGVAPQQHPLDDGFEAYRQNRGATVGADGGGEVGARDDAEKKKKDARRLREKFVMRAAVGIVEVLRQISASSGRSFTAALAVDSAIGAVIGDVTTSMRYSVFGVAPRNARNLLQAAPPLLGTQGGLPLKSTSVALALESFRRLHDRKLIARATDEVLDRIRPDFGVAHAPATLDLAHSAFDSTVFNTPMRWRLNTLGQIRVYSLRLTSDSIAPSRASSSTLDDLAGESFDEPSPTGSNPAVPPRFRSRDEDYSDDGHPYPSPDPKTATKTDESPSLVAYPAATASNSDPSLPIPREHTRENFSSFAGGPSPQLAVVPPGGGNSHEASASPTSGGKTWHDVQVASAEPDHDGPEEQGAASPAALPPPEL